MRRPSVKALLRCQLLLLLLPRVLLLLLLLPLLLSLPLLAMTQ
jgi:hypothetical protein